MKRRKISLVEKRTSGVEPHKKKGRSKGNRAWLSSIGIETSKEEGGTRRIHPGLVINPTPRAPTLETEREFEGTGILRGSAASSVTLVVGAYGRARGRKNFGERVPPPQSQKTQQQHKKRKKKDQLIHRPASVSKLNSELSLSIQIQREETAAPYRLSANRLGNR